MKSHHHRHSAASGLHSAAREYAVSGPLWCSEKYDAIYSRSEMHLVEGENHLIIKRRKEIIGIILDFLHKNLGT